MRALAAAYSRTLRTEDAQLVVADGPYRLIRHPGYLGTLLTRLGLGLASRSAPATAGIAVLMGRAYRRRIQAEEQLLGRDLPGYREYTKRTKRLIPFAW